MNTHSRKLTLVETKVRKKMAQEPVKSLCKSGEWFIIFGEKLEMRFALNERKAVKFAV